MRNGCLECTVVIASVTAPPPTRPLPLLLPTRGAAQGRLTRTTRTLPGPTPQSARRIPRRPLLLVDLHPRQDLGVHVGRQDGHGAEPRHPRCGLQVCPRIPGFWSYEHLRAIVVFPDLSTSYVRSDMSWTSNYHSLMIFVDKWMLYDSTPTPVNAGGAAASPG